MGTYAATNDSSTINLMSAVSGKTFDKTAFKQLFGILTNKSDATLDDVKAEITGTQSYGNAIIPKIATAGDIRAKNGGNDITVKFGKYNWTVTSLTTANNGDPVITLLLASGQELSKQTSVFAGKTAANYDDPANTVNGWTANNIGQKYLANLYSTSFIRVNVLNAGGKWVTDIDKISDYYNKNSNNDFAQYTMSDVVGSLTPYIVKPSQIKYQEIENNIKTFPNWGIVHTFKNDAYGKPEGMNWADNHNMTERYLGKINENEYTGWKDDYIWLPSITEAGAYKSSVNGSKGIWDLSANQRANTAADVTWLRTGSSEETGSAYMLESSGDYNGGLTYRAGAVRPALHLNLSKAAENSFTTIENIYDQANSKFNGANLNALAQAAQFADFKSMLQTAQDGTIKTSQDFGDTVVEFGTYTYGGVQRELTWIPAYLSEDTTGNPILTLWLAGTDSANGTLSDQEISTFSDGTRSNFAATSPSSNNYSTSYIRALINNNGKYCGNYIDGAEQHIGTGAGDIREETYTPTDGNKFAQLATGTLKDFIVTPENVDWQKTANKLKNDPNWTTETGHYTQNVWLSDKLWLPSAYELYDSGITDNSKTGSFTENGGLWKTGNGENGWQKRANPLSTWLRSGYPSTCNNAFNLSVIGDCAYNYVDGSGAVRPALHLNLNMAATSACGNNSHISGGEWLSDGTNHWKECTVCGAKVDSAAHSFDDGVRNPEPTCTEDGVLTKTCTVCGETKTESIGALGHTPEVIPAKDATCTETGLTEGSKCSVCQEILTPQTEVPKIPHTPETIPAVAPTCTETGLTEGSKCSVCQTVLTAQEEIPKIPHKPVTDAAIAPTCTTAGKTEGSHCSVCNTVIKAQETVPALGHTLGTWQHDDTNHWKLCSVCNTKQENAAHNFGAWTVIKEPTATESGERSCTCTVCGYIKTETIVQDENGNWVSGLPELPDPDSNYKLEITIKATDKVYALDGQSKGYNVRLWIVNNKTDDKKEFNKEMEVTLSLIVPHGMEDFTLYKLVEGGFEEIKPENYTVEAGVLSIRTTLPEEFIFNTAAAPAKGGIPWWVWLIVALAIVAVVIIIVIVVVKKKHTPAPETETVYVNGESYDDTELKRKVEEQNEKIDELLNREIPVDALSQTLTDDEMRSFFTDQELQSMVQQGKITQEDCDRVIRGRKR